MLIMFYLHSSLTMKLLSVSISSICLVLVVIDVNVNISFLLTAEIFLIRNEWRINSFVEVIANFESFI